MVQYDIKHTVSSEIDLANILRYIAVDLDSPAAALRMVETIDDAIAGLSTMPQRYPLVEDERLAEMGYRKLVVKNFIAFFSINEGAGIVNIERILHARQDWLRIL